MLAHLIGVGIKYLRKFATKSEADTTYGLYDRNGNFYIRNKPIVIIVNNIITDDEEYEGTHGLWGLNVSKNPDDNIHTNDDYDNYAKSVLKTNTLHRNNDPSSKYPKSSKVQKWNRILRTIWNNRKEYEGSGVVVIPCDPNAFRKEFTRISLCLYSARSLHSLIPCLLTDQNFKNNSEKGHSRNISMRLFQNLTNSFREDFL